MTNNGSPSPSPTPNPNPNPNPAPAPVPSPRSEPTPRRRRRTRGSSRPLSNSPRTRPPAMGVAGQSALSPNTGPRHPTPAPTGPPPPSNPFYGVPGAVALPVGGTSTVHRTGGVLENPAARKRVKEGGATSGQGGNNQQGDDDARAKRVTCTVCGKRCLSTRTLFKHMWTHRYPDANPPPAEEFEAGLPGVVQAPEDGAGGDAAEGGDVADPPAAEEGGEGQQGAEEGRGDEPRKYRVPDLNYPPPDDDDA